ncbi:MAG: helix-turn-helix transcriptional regulator [Actinobacteria bacterium]|nr:helix-turn-helix transcriptional regulator [Actinomycetota bacterium]MCG2802232.1 helix-turn-helix transcriptional regulator [Cellulomonas sp.]
MSTTVTERPLDRHHELGAFLRARRESTVPESVGYTSGSSRRTPGLRREEVAVLAGVGVTWYTWLEQGRPVNASEQVLSAIARALLLDELETAHLFVLAGVVRRADDVREQCRALSPAVQVVIDQLDPLPALVLNGRYDILAVNDAYCRLVDQDVPAIADGDRNWLYLALTDPHWRTTLVDWRTHLDACAAQLRVSMAEHLGDPLWTQQLTRLLDASPEFEQAWSRHEVRRPEEPVKRFFNPRIGVIELRSTSWWVAPRHGTRLISYTPVDEAGRAALATLTAPAVAVR